MEEARGLARAILDPLTMEILILATRRRLYPNEIARKIGKSNSLVVKRLKELEKRGVIRGSFITKGGKAVKSYELSDEELLFRIDLKSGEAQVQKKKSSPLYEVIKEHPYLFEGYENYLLWCKGKLSPEEFSSYTGLTAQESKEALKEIGHDIEGAFLTAYFHRLRGWKESLDNAYLDFVDDYVVIPTQRLRKMPGFDDALIDKISRGETLLSSLKEEFPTPDLNTMLKELEKMKMLVLEEKHFPRIAFDKVIELAKGIGDKPGDKIEETLYTLGRDTGKSLVRFLPDSRAVQTAFKALFGAVRVEDMENGERVILPNCKVCGSLEERRACHFVGGLMESVLETHGLKAEVKDERKQGDKHSCAFSIRIKGDGEAKAASDKLRALLGA